MHLALPTSLEGEQFYVQSLGIFHGSQLQVQSLWNFILGDKMVWKGAVHPEGKAGQIIQSVVWGAGNLHVVQAVETWANEHTKASGLKDRCFILWHQDLLHWC